MRKDSLNHEFFERQLIPGIHYYPVDTVEEVPDAIRRLQADDAVAKAMALAGQERMAQMDTEEVTHFAYQMLKGYAALQRFTPRLHPRAVPWVPAEATLEARAGPSKGRRPPWRAGSRAAGGCSTRLCCRRHPRACTNASASTRRLQL